MFTTRKARPRLWTEPRGAGPPGARPGDRHGGAVYGRARRLWLERDRLERRARAVRLHLPDVVSRRAHSPLLRELNGAGRAVEVDALPFEDGADRLVELLEGEVLPRRVRHRHDGLADLGRVRRPRLEGREE